MVTNTAIQSFNIALNSMDMFSLDDIFFVDGKVHFPFHGHFVIFKFDEHVQKGEQKVKSQNYNHIILNLVKSMEYIIG